MRYGPLILIVFILTVTGLAFGPMMCDSITDDQLRRRGEPAVARILGLEDTGNRFNDNPEVEIELEVRREGGPTYTVSFTRVYSVVELMNYPVGTEVNVRIDPEDSTSLVIIGRTDAPAIDR